MRLLVLSGSRYQSCACTTAPAPGFCAGLGQLGHQRDQVVAKGIARARQVLAVSTLNYSEDLLPPMQTSMPNVFVLNSAQIANGTLNVNETLGVVNNRLPELVSALRTLRREAA